MMDSAAAASLRAGLASLPTAAKAVPYALLLTIKCLYCATLADEFRSSFIIHYWVGVVVTFGGHLATEALLKATPFYIFGSNTVGVVWTLCW
jgi:hypothetical protein